MDFEFETTRTGLANAFAAAGAELLAYQPLVSTAVAAIPDTQPQKYAIAGTLPGILQMAGKMMGEDAVEKPTGDLTDEQSIFDLAAEHEANRNGLYGPVTFDATGLVDFARAIERAAIAAHLERQAQQAEQPKLNDIELYRQQMAGISCAAFGHWKEGDSIHPDYDTVPLRDVAKLYAEYEALRAASQEGAHAAPSEKGGAA